MKLNIPGQSVTIPVNTKINFVNHCVSATIKSVLFFGIRESIFKEKKHEKERKWISCSTSQT